MGVMGVLSGWRGVGRALGQAQAMCRRLSRGPLRGAKKGVSAAKPQAEAAAEEAAGAEAEAEAAEAWPRVVLTGLQPTGALHVGNYWGAVQRCVRLQAQEGALLVCVADLHALTAQHRPQELTGRVRSLVAALLAAGLQPERTVLWRQSAVPRHAELCWVLTCLAPQARLAALPQYRERAASEPDVRLGSLLYPVLQAADVLLFRATHVPVGQDQLQHLQVAAALVRVFRHRYGRAFPSPQPLLESDGAERLRSLRDPSRKMSKSDADAKSRILLTDSDADIRLKLRKAVTDCRPDVSYEPEQRPGVSNLVRLHCLAADLVPEEAVSLAEGMTTAQYKGLVADALVAHLGPLRERARALEGQPQLLDAVLADGAARARRIADDTYQHVASLLGLATHRH